MRPDQLEQLSKEDLIAYVQMLQRTTMTIDGYWFMNVEDRWGTRAATDIDEQVWGIYGAREAQWIMEAFHLEPGKMESVVRATQLCPEWTFWNVDVRQMSEGKIVFQQPKCFSQAARVRLGRGLFPCHDMERGYFTSFVQAIVPELEVRCTAIPPHTDPQDLSCSWVFELKQPGT